MQDANFKLLENASATGSGVRVLLKGTYVWSAVGTFSGATLTLQVLGPDGVTYITTAATLTAAGTAELRVGAGSTVRVLITGGPPSGIYSNFDRAAE